MFFSTALLAMAAELAFGYPQWLQRQISHPVMWIGAVIDWLDRHTNRDDMSATHRRWAGLTSLAAVLALTIAVAAAISGFLAMTGFGLVIVAVLAATFIAQRSLADHVSAVADSLDERGVEGGRESVSHIVGRDTAAMDESEISRAAIESLAENFSDGVVAPIIWLGVAGLPGIAAYKAINTADSMIGHRSEKYLHYGWAAARLDDLVNLPASRLTALLVVIAAFVTPGASAGAAMRSIRSDARHHRSPNAGWPEAAFAGALGLELAGPRTYDGHAVNDAVMGAGGRAEANSNDIRRALRLYWIADLLLAAILALAVAALTIYR